MVWPFSFIDSLFRRFNGSDAPSSTAAPASSTAPIPTTNPPTWDNVTPKEGIVIKKQEEEKTMLFNPIIQRPPDAVAHEVCPSRDRYGNAVTAVVSLGQQPRIAYCLVFEGMLATALERGNGSKFKHCVITGYNGFLGRCDVYFLESGRTERFKHICDILPGHVATYDEVLRVINSTKKYIDYNFIFTSALPSAPPSSSSDENKDAFVQHVLGATYLEPTSTEGWEVDLGRFAIPFIIEAHDRAMTIEPNASTPTNTSDINSGVSPNVTADGSGSESDSNDDDDNTNSESDDDDENSVGSHGGGGDAGMIFTGGKNINEAGIRTCGAEAPVVVNTNLIYAPAADVTAEAEAPATAQAVPVETATMPVVEVAPGGGMRGVVVNVAGGPVAFFADRAARVPFSGQAWWLARHFPVVGVPVTGLLEDAAHAGNAAVTRRPAVA